MPNITVNKYKEKTKDGFQPVQDVFRPADKMLMNVLLLGYRGGDPAFSNILNGWWQSLGALQNPDNDDETIKKHLENLGSMKETLREPSKLVSGKTNYQVLKEKTLGINRGYDEEYFFKVLHDIDAFYGLGLKVEELDEEYLDHCDPVVEEKEPEPEPVVQEEVPKEDEEAHFVGEEEKEEEPEIIRPIEAPVKNAKEPYTWGKYAELHKPEENKRYTAKERGELLSKQMIGSWGNFYNAQKATPFSKSAARKGAETIRKTFAFKAISGSSDMMKNYAQKTQGELAEEVENIRRPFKNMNSEQRKNLLRNMKSNILKYLDSPEGRSSKYREMYNSLANADPISIHDSNEPGENGEELLQNIYDKTCAYMEGKKSKRRKPEGQNSFDQALDIICALGKATPAAELSAKGMVARINEVRRGHKQEEVNYERFGAVYAKNHSNRQVTVVENNQEKNEPEKDLLF